MKAWKAIMSAYWEVMEMRKLISADLHHLCKFKIFIIALVFVLISTSVLVYIGSSMAKREDLDRVLDDYYFKTVPLLGLYLSAFISLFLGTGYSDGVLRNKIVVGHKRGSIYFSGLLSCLVGSFAVFAAYAIGGLSGVPFLGLWSCGTSEYISLMAVCLMSVFSITSILVMEAHLITNKPVSTLVTVFTALGIIMLSSYFYNALCEPEMMSEYVRIAVDGIEVGPDVPNPSYIGGMLRSIYQAMLLILPAGQQILIANSEITNPILMCLCSMAVIVVSSGIGVWLFRKKDIN